MLRVKGSRTFSPWGTCARDQPPSWVISTPSLPKLRSSSGKNCGALFFTSTLPPVMAPSARKVTTSWKSSTKVKSTPCSSSTPSTVKRDVPTPEIRAPMRCMNAQNSCTCGSDAALVSSDSPSASAAHSTKFSVVVTDA